MSNSKTLPPYVRGKTTTLRYVKGKYYRDAGHWDCDFEWRGDELYSKCVVESFNNVLLKPCSYTEWRKDNAGYLRTDTKAEY
jgi:hypothetical protein